MANCDCHRFEDAIASGSPPDDALSEHARTCPQCRGLAEIAALRISPVRAGDEDPVPRSIQAAAARVAALNADRWQRRRRTVPLAIGVAGYLVAASAALLAFLPGSSSPGIGSPLGVLPMAVPTPTLGDIAAAFAGSAVWTALMVLLGRSRHQETGATAGGP
ncbi:hypothetical protein AMK68_01765 [candidate division KD3-62 bacterium DG_56]|uniref:Zinc-finger domain-containing protein n=1 Tax=candidate division KD3-62 bacterium DG_56 TaxID=1704032 RepID=A0A0S7XPP7_9BACT|nr:MAG: hypothetical protein AMK68_01765 [candidate division KD3-62 bacterium DG_56]